MKQIKKASTFCNHLNKRFNKGNNSIHAFDREGDGTIVISAEDGDQIKGWPVGDYYDAAVYDPEEKFHEFGINKVLKDWCESKGWGLDWENPGCIVAYRDF